MGEFGKNPDSRLFQSVLPDRTMTFSMRSRRPWRHWPPWMRARPTWSPTNASSPLRRCRVPGVRGTGRSQRSTAGWPTAPSSRTSDTALLRDPGPDSPGTSGALRSAPAPRLATERKCGRTPGGQPHRSRAQADSVMNNLHDMDVMFTKPLLSANVASVHHDLPELPIAIRDLHRDLEQFRVRSEETGAAFGGN